MPFQYASPSREGTRSLGLSCRFGPWQRSQEGPMPCGRPAFRQSCGLECLEYDILDWACRQRAVAGLWGARWYHRRAIKECVLSDKISRRLGSFVDVQICTETSKSAATIEKRHSNYTGWKCIIVPLALLFSHRLQYTLFGNMMFLFEGRWIVDCSKYSDRQPLRSFFDKQARLKCTVANAKLSFKTCEKRLRTSKSQTFKNNECVLKWLPISVLYISIGCLQFLWCSYQPQPCIRARFLLCEFVNWYQRLYCVVCTWLWFWVLGGAALQVDAADQTRIQTKKCIYIYIFSLYVHINFWSFDGFARKHT